ncbi:chemotaxis protein CheX [Phycicoccus avicenniae]|uniref:chemotaxis protein CheX n=1 Tax=Phycicoccus avicenniae TaxID=2828860 RepID=UPI003D29C324
MTTIPAPIEAEYLDSIVTSVWESLFGEPVVVTPTADEADDAVRASVDIHGSWSGSVVVSCAPAVASGLARELLALPDDADPDTAEVHDALGEIANIVAGNVKSLLPDHAELGLPEVRQGRAAGAPAERGERADALVAATYHATAGRLRVDVTTQEGPR